MQPAKITIFLVYGKPDGLRTAEISNWTGKAISSPRIDIKNFLARGELNKPGIYILSGTDPETGRPAVYIGEAESVSSRIKDHSKKDFWVNVTAFVSKDENLTKAHSKYIEGKLILKASEADRAVLMNSASSNTRLPESDVAVMDVFLEKIYQLLPVLGINYFKTHIKQETKDDVEALLFCKIKGLVAKGKRTSDGFVVYKGSQAVKEHRKSLTISMKTKRDLLIEEGVLIQRENYLEFAKDHEFGSPSTASDIIQGSSTNGLIQWKNSDGVSLKDLELN